MRSEARLRLQNVCITQPAVSNAMARLCHLLHERLFMGRNKGLVPTSRADDLYAHVHPALNLLREQIPRHPGFDPASSHWTFVLAMAYGGGAIFGVALAHRLQREAPGLRLILRASDPTEEIPTVLRERRLDLALQTNPFPDPMLEQMPLADTQLVVLVREDHPRIQGAPRWDLLMEERFVGVYGVAATSDNQELLAKLEQIRLRHTVELPSALLLPRPIQGMDLLAVTSQWVALGLNTVLGVIAYPLSAASRSITAFVVWHRAVSEDPGHRWLQQQLCSIRQEFADQAGQVRPSSAICCLEGTDVACDPRLLNH